jgi:hypothetical protein
METDDLIRKLSASSKAVPLDDKRGMALMLGAVALPVAVFLSVAGVRHGLGPAISQPVVMAKTLLPMLAFALALPELPRLMRPEGAGETKLFRLGLPLLAALALLVLTLFDREALESCLEPGLFGVTECLGLISLLSILPVWVGLRLLGRGAVTEPRFAGAVAGFVAGTGVAAGYSLFCTRDNPLFYLVWYSVAIAIATGAGALLGRRMLRW